jgi:hypothetical protein
MKMGEIQAGRQAFNLTAQIQEFFQTAELGDFPHQFRP